MRLAPSILLGLVIASMSYSCEKGSNNENPGTKGVNYDRKKDDKQPYKSKTEIEREYRSYSEMESLLDSIAKSPPVSNLKPGAMCYAAGPAKGQPGNFTCPICHKATKYPSDLIQLVESSKKKFSAIKGGMKIVIKEEGLCLHCNPDKKGGTIKFIVYYPDRKDPLESTIYVYQLNIISQFLAGNRVYKDAMDFESDMKTHVSEFRKIFLGK